MVDHAFTFAAATAVLVMLGLSAFFSSSEIAIFSSNAGSTGAGTSSDRTPDVATADPDPGEDVHATRDDPDAEASDGRAATLAALRGDPHRLLVTLLVGNNLVNVAISSVVTVVLVQSLPPGPAVTVATVLAASLVLVFGEIIPKAYGLGHAESWSLTVARPVRLVELLLLPIVVTFDVATRTVTTRLGGDPAIEEVLLEE